MRSIRNVWIINGMFFFIASIVLFYGSGTAADGFYVVGVPRGCPSRGDAGVSDVLDGKTFSNSSAVGLTGIRSPALVPKTGQKKCYDSPPPGPHEVPCAGTGQDGELQRGVAWPTPRLTDNGDGTVTDRLTGLVWLRNANCLGAKKTRAEALTFAASLYDGYGLPVASLDCGLSDGSSAGQWRLPNRFELESLLDLGQTGPSLPVKHPFTRVQLDYYWTSSYSSYYVDLGVGWAVHFSAGDVEQRSWELDPSYVWLVRDPF